MLSSRQAKVRRAFLVAPLAGPVVLAFSVAMGSILEGSHSLRDALDAAFLLAPWFFFGLPFAYAVGLIVGLPCYWLLKRHGRLHLFPILAITGVLGPIALLGAVAFWTGTGLSLSIALFAVPAGMAVGLTFWLLGVRGVSEDRVA